MTDVGLAEGTEDRSVSATARRHRNGQISPLSCAIATPEHHELPGPKAWTSKPVPVRTSVIASAIALARMKSSTVVSLRFLPVSACKRRNRDAGPFGERRVIGKISPSPPLACAGDELR